MKRVLGAALLLLAIQGCVADFDSPTTISKPRVLAGRSFVPDFSVPLGEQRDAWPSPGDEVAVEWLVVDGAGRVPTSWVFLACPLAPSISTEQFCAGQPIDVQQQPEPSDGAPVHVFTVPDDASSILVKGVICVNGTVEPDLENADAECVGEGATRLRVSKTIEVAGADAQNLIPDLSLAAFGFESRTLYSNVKIKSPGDECVDLVGSGVIPSYRRGDTGGESQINMNVPPFSFETYEEDGETRTEEYAVQAFVTAGELSRRFSDMGPDKEWVQLDWKWPKASEIPDDGQLVRFYWVVRDKRGGTAWRERDLCALP